MKSVNIIFNICQVLSLPDIKIQYCIIVLNLKIKKYILLNDFTYMYKIQNIFQQCIACSIYTAL